jgi:hypothetical protein
LPDETARGQDSSDRGVARASDQGSIFVDGVYRPVLEPGGGARVDPLGEGLMKLLPDGFTLLLAPAAALPAPLLRPPLVPVVALPVVPLLVDPVAAPPAPVLPPAAPPPLCANASVLERVIAAATAMLMNFMMSSFP